MVTQFGPIWPTLGERAALQSTIKDSYKEITNGLREISTRAHKEQFLISSKKEQFLTSTHFPNLTNEQDTQWFSLSQGVYNVSQPKRSSLQRHSTLKLPPL